ncbi:hypothetical protein GCM10028796_46710 [Ramlibacter monticola]|uniref:Tail fiber domain-containing protein n=1 Tax=Ramlibacter monticola TaxID=1926872 RepID=A0A936Z560_9BURK|nr:hypothetical protein [Ramlibacter monticola]MBL0394296.1 hypothetical protein [Ramlibacter monticola]
MGKKSAPAAPDYTGLAEKQGQQQQDLLSQQTWANRANQYNPYGSQTWQATQGTDPVTGKPITQWGQTTTLDPRLQQALNSQFGNQATAGQIGTSMMGNLRSTLGSPVSTSGLNQWGAVPGAITDPYGFGGTRQRTEDAFYKSATSRLDPQWQQRQGDLETQLANQGITRNSDAWEREMGNFGRERTDAYDTAMRGAITGAGAEARGDYASQLAGEGQAFGQQFQGSQLANTLRGLQLNELFGLRNQGINEYNSLMGGSQVQMPSFGDYTQAGMGQATDYMGAAQQGYQGALDSYNARGAQRGQTLGTLGQLGGSAMMAVAF